jgi:UDP:flavonoid glycosyltransferase YjiC (YdhE family)
MKVLVVSTPGAGHVIPLVPIIGALLAGGNEVVVASGPEAAPIVEKTGARFAPAGRSQAEWMARLATRVRGNPGDGLAPERILHYFLPRAFAEIGTDEMIDDVLRHGRELAPDLVLFEAFALAGPLVAELLGVPGVAHMFGPLPPIETVELANDAVSPIWRAFGCDAPGWAGMYRHLTIQICPPSLDVARVPTGETLRLRPTPLPLEPRTTSTPPRVYVSFGTLFNANLDLFRVALEALADEPVDVVMTVGRDQDPAALAPFPANVRVERFIPQAELLPSCAAVVHHGGAGTMFGALAHGVPQVILPQGADNYENAQMCERAGAAVALHPDDVTPANLAASVQRVLHNATYADSSGRLADEIASMPDAIDIADTLRAWVPANPT